MSALVTIVIPVFNERPVLPALHRRIGAVLEAAGERAELLFVDDGSRDGSGPWLEELAAEDPRVALLALSRNFGKEAAVSAGLDHARGEAVIVIDADLQDPPELIPELLRRWREGYDVVYTVRASRRGESWLKLASARGFYRVMGRLSAVPVPADAGDYRLLSRRAVEALKALPESQRYLKGLYAWVGFPQTSIPYHREARAAGNSKWSFWRLWNHALDGITSFSTAPLKLATWLGLATSTLAFLYGLFLLLRTLLFGNPVPGYPSLIIVILFLGGVQLICLGIIGEYLGRTYEESKRRPLYLVKAYRPGSDD